MENENESNSLIRDLKAGMRKEKIIHHLKANQKRIITASIIIVAALVLWFSWCIFNKIQSEKYSATLHQAMIDEQDGNLEKSIAALKEISESSAPKGVKSIASLKYADQLLKNDEKEKAVEAYLNVNKNKKFDTYVREYAGLVALKILVNSNADKEKIYSLANDLEKNGKVLKYYIIEQKGIFEWNLGNFDEANKLFSSIAKNPEVSAMLSKRAVEMVAIYNSKFADKKVEAVQKNTESSQDKKLEEK